MQWTYVFNFKRLFLALTAFLLLCLSSAAQESLITSVTISKPKDLNGAYQLTVKADKPVEYKEKAQNADSVYFDLKNALTVDNLDTIYDNVSGVDALIVQQLENSKVRIYVNGINTSNTRLVFETKQATGSNAKNEIIINRPIREYRPTNDINEIAGENIDWDDNSFNPEHLFSSFFGLFGEKTDLTLVVCIVLLAACAIISKKVFAKVKLQEEPLIGLSSAYKNDRSEIREGALNAVYKQVGVPNNSHVAPKNQSLKYADIPNLKQRQNYRVPANPIRQNYALNAYQNSQKNPYVSRGLQNKTVQQVSYQKRIQKPSSEFATKVQRQDQQQKKGANIENIKFLESVTKIYEQSGRVDLAQGLREGINRRKSAV